jgi:hypothetical protein
MDLSPTVEPTHAKGHISVIATQEFMTAVPKATAYIREQLFAIAKRQARREHPTAAYVSIQARVPQLDITKKERIVDGMRESEVEVPEGHPPKYEYTLYFVAHYTEREE